MWLNNAQRWLPLIALVTSLVVSNHSYGQSAIVDPLVSQEVELSVDSGKIYHTGKEQALVWSETLLVPDALWLRLKFDQIVLAGSPLGGSSSTLKITSLEDGKFQILNSVTSKQWRNTSAYFNGNAVKIELYATSNGRLNLIQIGSANAGEFDSSAILESICDNVDDRQLSDDPRCARGEPIGCTCWLFDDRNNCFITAGHCANGTDIAMFNVPLSDSSGNRQFPGPEDQYAVDIDSMQFVNSGIGSDWSYFGCFPNSNTGLTAFQAQGDSYQLGTPSPVQNGDEIRITGYGSTSFPVDPTWNSAQKTHVGQYDLFTNEELGYRTDTTGGNSGSPIIFEATGEAIGVHTHGGCSSNGNGRNFGTSIFQNAFSTALSNPLGVCAPSVDFDYPSGLPELISPTGGNEVTVNIDTDEFTLDPATAMLHYDDGSGFQAISVPSTGKNMYQATFPAVDCGTILRYYFSIEDVDGELFTSPQSAPASSFAALAANGIAFVPFVDDFEIDLNWSVAGDADTGQWERGIPAGDGNRNDPTTDADGSGNCYVTENGAGNTDVDGGSTILTSPTMDATSGAEQDAILKYYRWFDSDSSGDAFAVEISNNNGASWQTVETVTTNPADSTGGWKLAIFEIEQFVTPTDQMRVRFTASDTGSPSIVEAGVDGVTIEVVDCMAGTLLGDVNLDGAVNLLDVAPFVDLISNSEFQLEADINMDGNVDLLDVGPFIDLL